MFLYKKQEKKNLIAFCTFESFLLKGKSNTDFFYAPYFCVLLIRTVFLQTFTVIYCLCRYSVGLYTAIQSAVFEVPYVLYVFDERPTCDVTDNERCSGSSERKIPRALAT